MWRFGCLEAESASRLTSPRLYDAGCEWSLCKFFSSRAKGTIAPLTPHPQKKAQPYIFLLNIYILMVYIIYDKDSCHIISVY